jgi:ferredoxin
MQGFPFVDHRGLQSGGSIDMATMRVSVDSERCTGHARCNASAPEIYDLDDNGYAVTQSLRCLLRCKIGRKRERTCAPSVPLRSTAAPSGKTARQSATQATRDLGDGSQATT